MFEGLGIPMLNFTRSIHMFAVITLVVTSHDLASIRANEIEFLGRVSLPGNASDLSGLSDRLADGTPHDQLGGFSAIEYDAGRKLYLVLPDRGPGDGAVKYHCRFHELQLTVEPKSDTPVVAKLQATHMLTDEAGLPFVGWAGEIDSNDPAKSRRFDPEGMRVGADGTVYISDEYGPHLLAFSSKGQLQRRIPVPAHLTVKTHHAEPEEEHRLNRIGRQSNRGMEGLAISPDGEKLYPIMQGPLLQDHAFDEQGKRLGKLVRFLEIPRSEGPVREWAYQLDHASYGISEVTHLDGLRFLVLERDSRTGTDAKSKRLYEANFLDAAQVGNLPSLPVAELPQPMRLAEKTLFLDLLDPRFGLAGESLPPKIEGVTFGPNLPDGRRLLIVCSDNDFQPEQPSWIYAFAIKMSATN